MRTEHLQKAGQMAQRAPLPDFASQRFLDAHPELEPITERYLSRVTVVEKEEGLVFQVPTSFHLKALQPWQARIEAALSAPITAFEVRPQKRTRVRSRPAVQDQNQVVLELAPQNPLKDKIEKERENRIAPPEFIRSQAMDLPHELLRRWSEMVNGGAAGQSIWVYGAAGSGKSFLLKQLNAWVHCDRKLISVDVISFFQEWRRAIESKDTFSFIKKYRKETDLFVLENLDDLRGRPGTQQEVLFTINALIERGASFAISSTLPPQRFQELLEPQLYSRLLSGMTVEMPAPDRGFKESLWRHLLDQHGLREFPMDLMIQEKLFALKLTTVRKLHTLYINAIARLSLKKELTLKDLAELEGVHSNIEHEGLMAGQNPRDMIDQVAKLCGVSSSAIVGKMRRSDVSTARKFVCLALSKFLGLSNSSIALYIEKDPSTISYSLKIVEEEIQSNRHMNQQWNWISSQLGMED